MKREKLVLVWAQFQFSKAHRGRKKASRNAANADGSSSKTKTDLD